MSFTFCARCRASKADGLRRASAADISVNCSRLKLRRNEPDTGGPGFMRMRLAWRRRVYRASGACAAGEAKLTAARYYQLITSNLDG
jgi:hypothetical protein